MIEITERDEVERILADAAFRVPEADAAATRPAGRFRARVSRFVEGPPHEVRRRRIVELLDDLDVAALARAAAGRTRRLAHTGVEAVAAHVPVACLAEQLGFAEPDALPPLVGVLAAAYPAGEPSTAADAAVVRLLGAAPPAGRGGHRDDGVLGVQLLVQAHAATAGLIVGALRRPEAADPAVPSVELLAAVLRDAPPVRATRRVSPAGDELLLRLDAPGPAHSGGGSRTLAFGAGARACPAPRTALAIAGAVVDGLRPC